MVYTVTYLPKGQFLSAWEAPDSRRVVTLPLDVHKGHRRHCFIVFHPPKLVVFTVKCRVSGLPALLPQSSTFAIRRHGPSIPGVLVGGRPFPNLDDHLFLGSHSLYRPSQTSESTPKNTEWSLG